jgi:cyclophilin family peptidyl-prolyl cis-trans isomerase
LRIAIRNGVADRQSATSSDTKENGAKSRDACSGAYHSRAIAENVHRETKLTLEVLTTALARSSAASAQSSVFLQVVAPASLPEGYDLETDVLSFVGQQRQATKVKIPSGCEEQGRTFLAPLIVVGRLTTDSENCIEVPTGRWRDGLSFSSVFLCPLCKLRPRSDNAPPSVTN